MTPERSDDNWKDWNPCIQRYSSFIIRLSFSYQQIAIFNYIELHKTIGIESAAQEIDPIWTVRLQIVEAKNVRQRFIFTQLRV